MNKAKLGYNLTFLFLVSIVSWFLLSFLEFVKTPLNILPLIIIRDLAIFIFLVIGLCIGLLLVELGERD